MRYVIFYGRRERWTAHNTVAKGRNRHIFAISNTCSWGFSTFPIRALAAANPSFAAPPKNFNAICRGAGNTCNEVVWLGPHNILVRLLLHYLKVSLSPCHSKHVIDTQKDLCGYTPTVYVGTVKSECVPEHLCYHCLQTRYCSGSYHPQILHTH